MPVLRTSEGNIVGSTSIARYFALSNKSELLGVNDLEQTLVDEYLSLIDIEILPNSRAIMYLITGRVPCETQHKLNVIITELKKRLENYNKILDGKDFLIGDKITLADIQLASYIVYPLSFVMNAQWRNKVLNLMNWFYRVTALDGYFEQVFGRVKLNTKVLQAPKPPKKEKPKKKEEKKEKKDKKKVEKPATNINIDDFKRFVVNSKDPVEVETWIKEKFEKDNWSIWYLKYDIYKDEGAQLHVTSNLCSGFIERAEACRRNAFGVQCVLGQEPNLEIEGIWMWQGLEIMAEMKDHPTFEYYEAKKLDTSNDKDRKLIMDFWMKRPEQEIAGRMCHRRIHM